MPWRQVVAREVDQTGAFGTLERRAVDRQRRGRVDDQGRRPPGQRGERDDELHVGAEQPGPLGEDVDQGAAERDRVVERQSGQRVGSPHQLGDGQRVARGHGARAGRRLGGGRQPQLGHQRPHLAVVEPGDEQLGQPGLRQRPALAGAPGCDHEHRVGAEPAGREGQRPGGRLVEQVRVVEQHDERRVLGAAGQHRQGRGTDREGRRGVAVAQRERHPEGPGLRRRQLPELVGDVSEHEAERGIRHLLLGRGADHPHDERAGGQRGHLVEQRRLPDAGLPRDQQGTPATQPGPGQQLGHPPQLGLAPHDHPCSVGTMRVRP